MEQTIQSVINQTYTNIEYIIIDGGSTDKTLDIIKKHGDKLAKWVSGPDKGIYDAMNKAVQISTGDIIYFLNAGDYLINNKIIEKIAEIFSDNSIVGVYGNVELIKDRMEGKIIRGRKLAYNDLLFWRICHQGLFVRRFLFEEIGLFSLSLKFSADHEFIVRSMKKYSNNFIYLNEIIAGYREGGMSQKKMTKTKMEDLKIISANYNRLQFLLGAACCGFVMVKYKMYDFSEHISKFLNNLITHKS